MARKTAATKSAPISSETAETPAKQASSYVTIRMSRRFIEYLVLAILLIVALAAVAYKLHWHDLGLSTQAAQQRRETALIKEVGAIMLLPTETPTIATVTDAATLKGSQAFYEDARDGDILLVYSGTHKAILYRPDERKIINVAPVSFNDTSATTSSL